METENNFEFLMGDDMPHREFMEDNGLYPKDFSESLRQKLTLFDVEFAKALSDGNITDDEYSSLHAFSSELERLIRREWQSGKEKSQTGAVVAILIGIGAVVGLGKIFRS